MGASAMNLNNLWRYSFPIIFFLFFILTLSIFVAEETQKRGEASKASNERSFEKSEVISKKSDIKDEPSVLFNDPSINQAWGLKKSDAARAWSVSQGSKDIVVAVIDTGADLQHEDLKANLWINSKEIPNNQIDDDKNGFVDDVSGWNFVSNNNDLKDNHSHGTHIAGIIGAEAGNNKGISGISPHVSLMILKYYDPKVSSSDNLKNTVNAIRYATKMGAKIINYSGGGTEFSKDEYEAIKKAQEQEILFVAAAGNEKSNSDKFHYYPADYKLSNIISVTAIDPSTEVLSTSNYGIDTVDIAAPGQNILSTLPNNVYGYMTGTSQATAFVSGAAVLAMAQKKIYSADEIKKYILSTGDALPQLLSKTRTSKQLNLYKMLTIMDSNLSVSGVKTVHFKDTFNIAPAHPPLNQKRESASLIGDTKKFSQSILNAIKGKKLDKVGDSKSP